MTIDQTYADGGIVLGDEPGVGVTVDESAIRDAAGSAPDAQRLVASGPHVRPERAGLGLATHTPPGRRPIAGPLVRGA
jgi:hypothetical protein